MSASSPDSLSTAPRILIVDDDAALSQVVTQMVAHLGYVPACCARADEVLRYLETNQVDLMLVDYRMPELTGLDLIRLLKQENCAIPIIMMTGYVETESRIPAETRKEFIVLKKPFTTSQLAAAIGESLDKVRTATISK